MPNQWELLKPLIHQRDGNLGKQPTPEAIKQWETQNSQRQLNSKWKLTRTANQTLMKANYRANAQGPP